MKYLSMILQDYIDSALESEIEYILEGMAYRLAEGEYESEDELRDGVWHYLDCNHYHDQSRESSGMSGAVSCILSEIAEDTNSLFVEAVMEGLEDLARSHTWGSGEGEDGSADIDGGDDGGLEPSGDTDS